MKRKVETYIVNGRRLYDYEAVVAYADSMSLRIVNTEYIGKSVHLITLGK